MKNLVLEKKHIKRLYELLDQFEETDKDQEAAVIRWAIFQLEQKFDIKIGDLDEE